MPVSISMNLGPPSVCGRVIALQVTLAMRPRGPLFIGILNNVFEIKPPLYEEIIRRKEKKIY
jgi:hypothetical protein